MIEILKEHLTKYPKMQDRDAVKLLFQATFGANHLIENEENSLLSIENEWQGKTQTDRFENIGENYVRANINAFEKEELPLLNKLFVAGASSVSGEIDFTPVEELFGNAFLSVYLKEGIRPVSHSDAYRHSYSPAYRVIPKIFARYWNVLWKIYREAPRVIAIDGRAGAGKTTIANIISQIFKCDIIRADDFFLPPALRTPERLNEPGGNIHYERLKKQVIENLGAPFEYDVFDCSVMNINGKKKISTPMCVLEGSYSQHPYLGKYYDLGIFVTVKKEEQERRILNRNGEKMLKMFKEKWIPMEEKYIEAFSIEENSHIIIKND